MKRTIIKPPVTLNKSLERLSIIIWAFSDQNWKDVTRKLTYAVECCSDFQC